MLIKISQYVCPFPTSPLVPVHRWYIIGIMLRAYQRMTIVINYLKIYGQTKYSQYMHKGTITSLGLTTYEVFSCALALLVDAPARSQ
jgi:hypothetical protein